MDPFTQGALGAAAAQGVLGNEEKRAQRIWIAGALGGMAADLDILIRSPADPLLFYYFHRHFTHALFFIPAGGLLLALFLYIIPYFRPRWHITLFAATIGYATHGLLDATTNYGTVLYWPWSLKRVSWDWIFIIDPLFTLPLMAGIVLSVVYRSRKAVCIGLFLAALYMAYCAWQHSRALDAAKQYFDRAPHAAGHIRATPAWPGGLFWRGLARTENTLLVIKIYAPVFGPVKTSALEKYRLSKRENLPDYIRKSPTLIRDFSIFNWFTDGYIIEINRDPLILGDGRYLRKDGQTIQSLWGFIFIPEQPHVAAKYFLIVRPLP